MTSAKILQRIGQLETFAELILKEATMLKQELSGVVSDNSPRKGKRISTTEVLSKRAKSRIK
jgi:hypothetical protein